NGIVHIQGQADINHQKGHIKDAQMKLKASLTDLLINDLPKYWPVFLAPNPREWVTKNLSNGRVRNADLSLLMEMKVKGNAIDFDVKDVFGAFDFTNLTVNYIRGFPVGQKVSGRSEYDLKHFMISAKTGFVDQLKIKKGEILITGLDKK